MSLWIYRTGDGERVHVVSAGSKEGAATIVQEIEPCDPRDVEPFPERTAFLVTFYSDGVVETEHDDEPPTEAVSVNDDVADLLERHFGDRG